MYSTLSSVQSGAAAIMASTAGLGDVAYGVGEYRDVGDSFVYRLNQDVTTDTTAVQTGMSAWVASGGGDWEEAQLYALYQVANTVSWRPGSTSIVIWFGDEARSRPSRELPGASHRRLVWTIKVLPLILLFKLLRPKELPPRPMGSIISA
jgi:hypothetical protein